MRVISKIGVLVCKRFIRIDTSVGTASGEAGNQRRQNCVMAVGLIFYFVLINLYWLDTMLNIFS